MAVISKIDRPETSAPCQGLDIDIMKGARGTGYCIIYAQVALREYPELLMRAPLPKEMIQRASKQKRPAPQQQKKDGGFNNEAFQDERSLRTESK